MAETEKQPTGTIYDGTGRRLKGDGRGPSCALDVMDRVTHKQVLGPSDASTIDMTDADRFYLVPDALWLHKRLPLDLMADLAVVLISGGRVAIMAFSQRSLDAVVGVLRIPDVLMVRAREAAQKANAAGTSVGTFWDGTGAYLDGDKGHAMAWQADKKMRVKGFLNGSPQASARIHMLPSDRFYIMPRDYRLGGRLPVWIIGEMMKTLKAGGKVMVLAPDRASLNKLATLVSLAAGNDERAAGGP